MFFFENESKQKAFLDSLFEKTYAYVAGIGGASNSGVLVKGSNYLEALATTKYL